MNLTSRLLLPLSGLLCLAFGLLTPVYTQSATSSFRYRNPIVFQRAHLDEASKITLQSKLWIMEDDGTSLRQLTFGQTYDDHPSVYSDRERVLYAEFPVNALAPRIQSQLISLNIYTGAREVIEAVDGCALHHATLSPIDDLIAYHRDCGTQRSHWIGTGARAQQVSALASDGVRTREGLIATYNFGNTSPTGIALVELAVIHDKLQARIIYKKQGGEGPVAVSADGQWVAWDEILTDGDYEIFIGRRDGTEVRNLTATHGNDGHPWFSRDGRWVLFHSNRSGHFEIWRIDLKTQRSDQLTFGDGRYDSTRPRM